MTNVEIMYLNLLEMHLHWNLWFNTTNWLTKIKYLYQPSKEDSKWYILYYILLFSTDKSPCIFNLSLISPGQLALDEPALAGLLE